MKVQRYKFDIEWGERRGLNPRHPGPQPGALPAELRPPRLIDLVYLLKFGFLFGK